jgi:hypothetical protein
MNTKDFIYYVLKGISQDDLKCCECTFLYEDNLSCFCGMFDKNLNKCTRCRECVNMFGTVESREALKLKCKSNKKIV